MSTRCPLHSSVSSSVMFGPCDTKHEASIASSMSHLAAEWCPISCNQPDWKSCCLVATDVVEWKQVLPAREVVVSHAHCATAECTVEVVQQWPWGLIWNISWFDKVITSYSPFFGTQCTLCTKNIDYITLSWMNFDCWQPFCEEWGLANGQSICVRDFIVLYDYDPYQSSPNDQPDAELPLSAGEHILIMGDIDEVSKYYLVCNNSFHFDNDIFGTLMYGRQKHLPSSKVCKCCIDKRRSMNQAVQFYTVSRSRI